MAVFATKLKMELFPLFILDMLLQLKWGPPVVNSVDLRNAHSCLFKVLQLALHVRVQTLRMKSKKLAG